ncbi:putative beta-glucosidase G [Heliocybe sulcata]|uniref:Probable beta-glucosidase G n=1 Tax=Heliocybe sulcata TaxID=5364 RepID=A0A5C3MMM8_9AGAM|nr:putative beta-glucosidase G [Heliocybe sulcata]
MVLVSYRAALLTLLACGASAQWESGSYGYSPPVYPSPNMTGLGGWQSALAKADAFLSQLTLDEKAQMVTGTPGPCEGNIAPIPRLGFNGLCLQDGPLGARQADFVSVFPAGVTAAASWDRDLIYQRGAETAEELKAKGAHVLLGPVSEPLGRSPYGGRNWEGFSPDPYLNGVAMAYSIMGIQSVGIQACAKHFIGYEQETQRNPTISSDGQTIEAVSSNIDDRTIHEIYSWPFADAVRAGVSSVMCSYNRLNQSYACQNSYTLNGMLKTEFGFQGYVLSDWGATYAGVSAIEAGLDMDMPGSIGFLSPTPSYFGQNITIAVQNGSLAEERVDDMVRRVMTPYFYLNQDQGYPTVDPSSVHMNVLFPQSEWVYQFDLNGTSNRDVRDNHATLIRELGASAIVLLKNTNGALPLKNPKYIGVFGNDAGDLTNSLYLFRTDFSGNYAYGTLPMGGGSGTGRLTYIVPPLDAIKARAKIDGSLVQYILNNTMASTDLSSLYPPAQELDVCLVFLKTWATENYDRSSLDVDWDGNTLVEAIAASCNNTVVVTHSAGVNVLPFASHPNVTAIFAAHYPGQESGNSIVDVLYGDVNPSGRLPYTIALNESDYNTPILNLTNAGLNDWQLNFTESLLVDYRYFDYANKSVLYEFGYGLSYTNFSLGDMTIEDVAGGSLSALPPAQAVVPGGNPALFETVLNVTTQVQNTGSVSGATVPQLYVGMPSTVPPRTPPKQLRGFDKLTLSPGEAETVTFGLTRRDISYWDVEAQQWRIPEGTFTLNLGFTSRDIRHTMTVCPLC